MNNACWRVKVLDDQTAGTGLFRGYSCLFTLPDYWDYGYFAPRKHCELPGKLFRAKASNRPEEAHVFLAGTFWGMRLRFDIADGPIYVAWRVRRPILPVAGGQYSLVGPDEGPWRVWCDLDDGGTLAWHVHVKEGGQWIDHPVFDGGSGEWIDVQLVLHPDRIGFQVDQRPRGAFSHEAYGAPFEIRFGSAQTASEGDAVVTEYRSVYVNDIPYPYGPRQVQREGPEDVHPDDEVRCSFVCEATPERPRHSEGDIIALKDGRLLLTWSEFYAGEGWDGSPGRISCKTSTDHGRTWGHERVLIADDQGINATSASLLRAANGDILLAYYHRRPGMRQPGIVLRRSTDEGDTWTDPVPVTPETGNRHSANNACLRRLSTGRIVLACREYIDNVRWPYCAWSDDDGRTWRAGRHVPDPRLTPAQKRGQNVNEPCVVELADGRLLMSMRSIAGGQFFSYSSDGGETWTKPRLSPLVGTCSPAMIRRVPGRDDLLAVFTYGYLGRTPLVSAISGDGGLTWRHLKRAEQSRYHSYGYTSITFYRDRVLLTYMHHPGFTSLMRFEVEPGYIDLRLTSLPLTWFYREVKDRDVRV